jgi:hypothetical protein
LFKGGRMTTFKGIIMKKGIEEIESYEKLLNKWEA